MFLKRTAHSIFFFYRKGSRGESCRAASKINTSFKEGNVWSNWHWQNKVTETKCRLWADWAWICIKMLLNCCKKNWKRKKKTAFPPITWWPTWHSDKCCVVWRRLQTCRLTRLSLGWKNKAQKSGRRRYIKGGLGSATKKGNICPKCLFQHHYLFLLL